MTERINIYNIQVGDIHFPTVYNLLKDLSEIPETEIRVLSGGTLVVLRWHPRSNDWVTAVLITYDRLPQEWPIRPPGVYEPATPTPPGTKP